ncbi:MAG: CPBP family intramembrane metalloprotease [Oscillospiraceae bacterium]|nr:CPBP family intramembrane metalloprotease [Oscillospiraceae bacterium]
MQKNIVFPSRAEGIFGWCYLLFCQTLLPYALNFIFGLVGITLSAAQLNLTYFGVNFLVIVVVFRKFWVRTGKDLLDRTLRVILTAVGSFAAYLLVSQLVGRLITWLRPDFFNANDQSIAAIAQSHYIPTLICTVFLVPVAEECLHRGAVFGSLFQRNAILAYAVSTVIFSLVHINWMVGAPMILLLSFLQYIPAGLCLAAAYHISGSITAPILVHMAVNAIGILALR